MPLAKRIRRSIPSDFCDVTTLAAPIAAGDIGEWREMATKTDQDNHEGRTIFD
jgi:hypothetical protein